MEIDSSGVQISKENLYYIQYYKEFVKSNDKLFNILNGYMLHCGIIGRDVLTEREGAVDSRYLAKTTT